MHRRFKVSLRALLIGPFAAFDDALDLLFRFVNDFVGFFFFLEKELHTGVESHDVEFYLLPALSHLAYAIHCVSFEFGPSEPAVYRVDRGKVMVTHDY